MINRWSDRDAETLVADLAPVWGEAVALRTYSARLLGRDPALVLHGGGNTSVKSTCRDLFGDEVPSLFVKGSGLDMASIGPEGHPALALEALRRLRSLPDLADGEMLAALRRHLFASGAPDPSIEALVHAFLPHRYIDHTHADAVLALTNRADGERHVREALGPDVIVLPYVTPGFKLAKAAAAGFEGQPGARGMVWLRHGIVTWGDSARQSYETMIELATRAEEYLEKNGGGFVPNAAGPSVTSLERAWERYAACAPILRGLLSPETGDPDQPRRPVILRPLIEEDVLSLLESEGAKDLAVTPPLTADHLIRTKPLPVWVNSPAWSDIEKLRKQISSAVDAYAQEYSAYVERQFPSAAARPAADPLPRVVLVPGLGAVCAGADARAADVARDITAQTLAAKARSAALGPYEGLSEAELFSMEFRGLQLAKLGPDGGAPLSGRTAVVTGAAGAIGSGICEVLLREGCHVAATDLAGAALQELEAALSAAYPGRVFAIPLDVTDDASVKEAFRTVICAWGGIDLAVINAGLAHVSTLAEMDLESFRRLERVNVEGTLLLLRALARHYALQGLGGDVVLVSTKNVFSPGAQFGAYSATKAASHQLARIASLELAPLGVRVNMVAPDAVFSHGARKSGLWKEVGPGRMRARGLDEEGLEDYYRSRNLLKARVTAEHVARAVLFFATRQTPPRALRFRWTAACPTRRPGRGAPVRGSAAENLQLLVRLGSQSADFPFRRAAWVAGCSSSEALKAS